MESVSDLPTEPRETRFDNGQLKESYRVARAPDGAYVKHGHYVRYHSNGQKSEEGRYERGELEGKTIAWFDNGRVSRKANYQHGKLDGEVTSYEVDGLPSAKQTWARGVAEGPFSLFHQGKQVVVGGFKQGNTDGTWRLRDRQGTALAEVVMKQGEYAGPVKHPKPPQRAEQRCPLFLGLELGATSYAEVKLGFLDRNVVPATFDRKNPASHGRMVSLDPSSVGLEKTESATLVFDSSDMLVAARTKLKRDDTSLENSYRGNFKRLKSRVSNDYQLVKQSVPFVGHSWAKFRRPGCRAEIDAPHLDFIMVADYWLDGHQESLKAL